MERKVKVAKIIIYKHNQQIHKQGFYIPIIDFLQFISSEFHNNWFKCSQLSGIMRDVLNEQIEIFMLNIPKKSFRINYEIHKSFNRAGVKEFFEIKGENQNKQYRLKE